MSLSQALAIAAASLTLTVEPAFLVMRVSEQTDALLSRVETDMLWTSEDARVQMRARGDGCA